MLGTVRQRHPAGRARTPSTRRWPPRPAWRALSFDDRAAIILRAAELLAGPWRETLAASTMLGQSKTAQQAEIDSPCELVDFWRFNVHFARQILAEQPPANSPGVWNRLDHRPLEGFVYAITPFNFTAIAGNLPTAPALMGNVVVWKPSPTQTHAAVLLMRLLEEAGLPQGVINLVTGDGVAVSEVALAHPRPGRHPLHRLHRRPSSTCGRRSATNIDELPHLPAARRRDRRQGLRRRAPLRRPRRAEDGADPRRLRVPGPEVLRGLPRRTSRASIWNGGFKEEFAAEVDAPDHGRRHRPVATSCGAVIDERAFAKNKAAIDRAQVRPDLDDRRGRHLRRLRRLLRPAHGRSSRTDPANEIFTTEYFGPILAVHVYEDATYDAMLDQMESRRAYALTGAVIAQDRAAVAARDARSCASRPATSTSTTSRPAPSSASSRSAAAAPPAPTTRPAPRRT